MFVIYSISFFAPQTNLRQARQNRLQLVVDDLLLSGGSSGLVVRITGRDGDVTVVTSDDSNICLPWQPRSGSTNGDIGSTANNPSVDASEDELELVDVVALGARYSGEVDVEPGVVRKVWLSRFDDGGCDIESEVSIDVAIQRSGLVPSSWVTARARERDCGDLCGLCSVNGCADGSGEGDLNGDVATNVGSCEGEFWSSSVPQFGRSSRYTSLDGSDRVGVDVVQAGVGGIRTCRRAPTRTR